MRVHHISSAPINGGAARAGLRLHQGLSQLDGVESLWLDAGGLPDVPRAKHLGHATKPVSLLTRIRRRYWQRKMQRDFVWYMTPYSSPLGWGDSSLFQSFPRPDFWNLQWVSNFLDWEHLLPWMAEQAPIIWTLHDLNPLMGVWHYHPLDNETNRKREAINHSAVELKRRALSCVPKNRLTFVGPSKWMVEQCRQSQVTSGFPVIHIPYGLDTEVFTPRDKLVVRSMYGIADDELVLGFVADRIDDPRKGMAQLEAAIADLPSFARIHVLTVGNGQPPQFKFPHHHLGGIQSDHLLSLFYSACDLFVCPSLQDNLPNTVLESMACGTPVVAYETGGLPDMVRDGESGYIVKSVGDVRALATAICNLCNETKNLSAMRVQSRELAIREYSLPLQAVRNYQLGQKLINSL